MIRYYVFSSGNWRVPSANHLTAIKRNRDTGEWSRSVVNVVRGRVDFVTILVEDDEEVLYVEFNLRIMAVELADFVEVMCYLRDMVDRQYEQDEYEQGQENIHFSAWKRFNNKKNWQ